ncbi:hypothetical protein, partial [Gordonia sp. UBA7599]
DESDRLTRQRQLAEEGHADTVAKLAALAERLRLAREEPTTDGTATAVDDGTREEAGRAVAAVRTEEVEARLALRTAEERLASSRGRADSLRRTAR